MKAPEVGEGKGKDEGNVKSSSVSVSSPEDGRPGLDWVDDDEDSEGLRDGLKRVKSKGCICALDNI